MMTYAEARTILRKVYDQWAAVAKLHEVCEAAARAEAYLGSVETAVTAAKNRLAVLEEGIRVHTKEAEDSGQRAEAARLQAVNAEQEAQRRVVAVQRTAERDIAASGAAVEAAITDNAGKHAKAVADAKAEYALVERDIMALRAELEALKKRIVVA